MLLLRNIHTHAHVVQPPPRVFCVKFRDNRRLYLSVCRVFQADICHLIYKNYGTTVVEEPLNLCVRDQIPSVGDVQLLGGGGGGGAPGSALLHQEALSMQLKDPKRKSKKSLARERLEKTFKEKGFLIQTQQLESAQGATYCKFRQLRKFTRYLFRSWKHHLPGDVVDNGVANGQVT